MYTLTIDVEDWYQSTYDPSASISKICLDNTRKVLRLLSRYNVKATFFVQGMVARQYPGLVKEIKRGGHEVQSHGYSHLPVNEMSPKKFRDDLLEASKIIQDITGDPVTGFRAPDFSIDRESFWAFEVMRECGILYDSSIFPFKTSRYGIDGYTRGYSVIETPAGTVEELPVSVYQMKRPYEKRIPFGGGGYFRMFPYFFIKHFCNDLEKEGLPVVIYCHPYEFNPGELKQISSKLPLYTVLHQGIGRRTFEKKVTKLLQLKDFGTVSNLLGRLRK